VPQLVRFLGTTTAVATLVLSVGFQAQSSDPQSTTIKSGVDVVHVDVSVLDNKRRPVAGLTAADFTVLEDGRPRPITVFTPVVIPERARTEGLASWVRDVSPDVTTNDITREGRLVVIMFDWSIRFEDTVLARKIAAAAVNELGPGDLAAVVFTSPFSTAGTPQNFTSDRARLLDAINRPFAAAMHNPVVAAARDPRNLNTVMLDDPEGYESGDCLCRVCVLDTITRLADAVREVPGRRKSVLFIGSYFRSYESLQGPTSLLDVRAAAKRPRDPSAAQKIGDPADRAGYCSSRLKDARVKMLRATSLANLPIHVFDPVGLETAANSPLGGSTTGQMERRGDLTVLAESTGGRAVLNTNAPDAQVPAVFAESESYYLVGFPSSHPTPDGRFHKIEVKVNRPHVSVQTREGYYAGETRAAGLKPTVVSPAAAAGIDGVLPRTDIPLRLSVAPFAAPGRKESTVAIVVHAQQSSSTGQSGPIKVLAAAFDRNGRSIDAQEQTVAITSRAPAGGTTPYEVLSRLALAPGRYEIRVALDAGLGQRASVYTYVDVPDFARQPLSLSGLLLAVSPTVPVAPADAFSRITSVIPTARREMARTDHATVFLRVYQEANATVGPATITARITDTADRVVFNDVTQLAVDRFTADHGADYLLDLPAGRLASGEYLLTIEAAQGERTARRGMRFTMR